MKVNATRDISFKSVYTNKALKKGLEFAADNGALFKASAVVGFSLLRPISIWMTPNTDRENRLLAVAKSLSSSIVGFLLTLGLSIPLSKSIKAIDKNPEKYMNSESISNLKEFAEPLTDSKGYILATQLFKLGLDGLVSIPKSILVVAGMPYIMNKIDKNKNANKSNDKNITFKGSKNYLAKGIGKFLNNKNYQDFANKHKNSNFPMHIVAATDIVATGAFIQQTKSSNKIEENRKKTLMYNSAISTALSIASGYVLDKLLDSPTQKFIDKFKKYNKNDKNLSKQIQGIKIAKPILILGMVYYCLIPFISTFLAENAYKTKNKINVT